MFETFVDFAGLQRSRAARERRLPEGFEPHLKRTHFDKNMEIKIVQEDILFLLFSLLLL